MTTEEKDLLKEKIKNAINISSQKLIEKGFGSTNCN